jgi:GH15 family glucan-1,4-alpha-glucosidase
MPPPGHRSAAVRAIEDLASATKFQKLVDKFGPAKVLADSPFRRGPLRNLGDVEKMFTYANHVGLYAEQVSATGEQVGNFPQAFTHLALISAAINLDRALN